MDDSKTGRNRHAGTGHRRRRVRKMLEGLRQAFAEFLLVPTAMIAGFLILAGLTFALDRGDIAWLFPIRTFLQAYVFADASASAELLGTIAAGIITITSITISMLLIALQQSASALTHQVYDQFLRNWQNQAYFGFFVGLSLYVLVTLASAGPLNPVIGATVALLATVFALYLLIVLFYTTVNQMRPAFIIEAIHDHASRHARSSSEFVRKTRAKSRLDAVPGIPVEALSHGFVTRVDLDPIRAAVAASGAEVEVVLRIAIGDYVVFGQPLAEVRARSQDDALAVGRVLEDAIHREKDRDITCDPLDAIEELETIAWTSISTAQSDPDAGVLTICVLRDILARWSSCPETARDDDAAPVVYEDRVLPGVLDVFGSLAVSASESIQHQSYAEILRSFALLFDRLPSESQARVEDMILRSLSGMGDHVLTAELESAITAMIAALRRAGRERTAEAVRAAVDKLAASIGRLGARSTRAG